MMRFSRLRLLPAAPVAGVLLLALTLLACRGEEGAGEPPFPRGAKAPPAGKVGDLTFEVPPLPSRERTSSRAASATTTPMT